MGIYEICISNRFSNEPKSVYLSLYSEAGDKTWPFVDTEEHEEKQEEAAAHADMTVEELRVGVHCFNSRWLVVDGFNVGGRPWC